MPPILDILCSVPDFGQDAHQSRQEHVFSYPVQLKTTFDVSSKVPTVLGGKNTEFVRNGCSILKIHIAVENEHRLKLSAGHEYHLPVEYLRGQFDESVQSWPLLTALENGKMTILKNGIVYFISFHNY